jgi:hypothetical protein
MSPKESARLRTLKLLADAAHAHAKKCKKSVEDCPTCQSNIKWFRSLPLLELTYAIAS